MTQNINSHTIGLIIGGFIILSFSCCGVSRMAPSLLDESVVLNVLDGKSNDLEWNRPVNFYSNFPWEWDSVYFVDINSDCHYSNGDIVKILEEDDYNDDYFFIFFLHNNHVTKYAKINNIIDRYILFDNCLNPCRKGYAKNHQFYIAQKCTTYGSFVRIYTTDCDSATVFEQLCPR